MLTMMLFGKKIFTLSPVRQAKVITESIMGCTIAYRRFVECKLYDSICVHTLSLSLFLSSLYEKCSPHQLCVWGKVFFRCAIVCSVFECECARVRVKG